jgi:hypothetical protein
MKKIVIVLSVFFYGTLHAQETVPPTEKVSIQGKILHAFVFGPQDAAGYKAITIDSLVIYNHLHERKRTIKNIRGVLLKDILTKAAIDEANPKRFSEFYVTCAASDGYRIVFSWNEIFNTEIGDHILVAVEADGKKGDQLPDRILLLSAADINTGRRFMKGVDKITVDRVH